MDAFRCPQRMVLCHLLDQCNGLRRDFGLGGFGVGFVFPEEIKACAMPAQEGLRLEENERIVPILQTTRQDQEPEAVGGGEMRKFGLTLQNDQLVTQERILQHKLGFGRREVL